MWNVLECDSTASSFRFKVAEKGDPISHQRFLELLAESKPFRSFYNEVVADSGFEAFLWENKPITNTNLQETYECNLIENDYLAGKPADSDTFATYFDRDKKVVTFPNLGRDATLIAPCPQDEESCYPHIGRFVRRCGEEQIDDFWRVTAEQMIAAVGSEPRWLSTSGLGVFWLHARIDSRPKYYQTVEYRRYT